MGVQSRSQQLKHLLSRKDKVTSVMHPPSAFHARIMEEAGAEALFVGTSGVIGSYIGTADVGVATMTECVMIGGWIARAVRIPVILDGDTGHGGTMAIRRLVRECINAGIAGIRIDDQPIEGKRSTLGAGIEVVSLEQAIARYRAAVDMKNELDPNFVIMAQCYARNSAGGTLEDTLKRLHAYETLAGVDWVQFECPYSIEEIKQARKVVAGPLSFMKGKLQRDLDGKELLDLGINLAWYPGFTHQVTRAALWDFMLDFKDRGLAAWDTFQASRVGKIPTPDPNTGLDGEGVAKQRDLEKKYLTAAQLEKYQGS